MFQVCVPMIEKMGGGGLLFIPWDLFENVLICCIGNTIDFNRGKNAFTMWYKPGLPNFWVARGCVPLLPALASYCTTAPVPCCTGYHATLGDCCCTILASLTPGGHTALPTGAAAWCRSWRRKRKQTDPRSSRVMGGGTWCNLVVASLTWHLNQWIDCRLALNL